jgi:hypothetical protein
MDELDAVLPELVFDRRLGRGVNRRARFRLVISTLPPDPSPVFRAS